MTKSSKFKNPLGNWREISAEFNRICWGSRDELQHSVRIVLISILAWGFVTYAVDLVMQQTLQGLRGSLLRLF